MNKFFFEKGKEKVDNLINYKMLKLLTLKLRSKRAFFSLNKLVYFSFRKFQVINKTFCFSLFLTIDYRFPQLKIINPQLNLLILASYSLILTTFMIFLRVFNTADYLTIISKNHKKNFKN